MINIDQYQQLVLIPVISRMAGFHNRSINAMTMIAAHESIGGTYLKQCPKGPALGLYGMEAITGSRTYENVWEHSDNIWEDAAELGFISLTQYYNKAIPNPERMIFDMQFATFMARKRLHMDVRQLPDDLVELSQYLSEYWNAGGDATADEYYNDFMNWIDNNE